MPLSLVPQIRVNRVFDLSPDFLHSRGITLLLLDLDNTLAPYSGKEPSPGLCRWRDDMRAAGVELFIVSNTKTSRAARFSKEWGVPYIDKAQKPHRWAIYEALRQMGRTRGEAALVGDQIFTDVLGANLAGVRSIIVEPLELNNILYILRYIAEIPMRLCTRKEKRL